MSLPDEWRRLCRAVQTAWPASRYRDVGVVVGCSGGADSVALVRSLVQLAREDVRSGGPAGFFVIAHYNHALRGKQSDLDADFVRALAEELGVEFVQERGDGSCRDESSSRQARRAFFHSVLRRRGARYLALGHSLDDNVETMLFRLMRGTGPSGLTGIAPFRPLSGQDLSGQSPTGQSPTGQGDESDFVVARPMLMLGRNEIRDAMRSQGFAWRDDESNQNNGYQRNWIRNELIPMMQQRYPEVVAAMGRAIDGQRQWSDTIRRAAESWADRYVTGHGPTRIRRMDRAEASQAVVVDALRRHWETMGWPLQSMGQSHWDRIYGLICGDGDAVVVFPGSIEARRDDRSITLVRTV